MNIERYRFALELTTPLETATGSIDAREGVLLVVEHEGTRGIGEATPLPGWSESIGACERALERASERAETPEHAMDLLDPRETPAARHGLTGALADRRARKTDRPLYRQLGGEREVNRIAVNATIGDGTPAETAREASAAVDRGIECLKVKVGARSIAADCRRLAAVREAAPEATLRADANGAWSYARARRALDTIENRVSGVAYVEQPLDGSDLAGHATLRDESNTAIALDETLAENGLEAVLDAGAADVAICKPMVLGGIDRTRALATRARETGVEPVVTTTIDGAIARAGAVHLAASLAPIAPCGLATGSLLETDLLGRDPAPVADGHVRVPQGTGTVGGQSIRAIIEENREKRR